MIELISQTDVISDLLELISLSALISCVIAVCVFARTRHLGESLQLGAILIAVGLIGLIVGQIAGQTREQNLSSVLPAALSTVGGIVAVIFGKDNAATRNLAVVALIALVLNMYIGIRSGAYSRAQYDALVNDPGYRLKKIIDEAALCQIRLQHGLKAPCVPIGTAAKASTQPSKAKKP